MTKLAMIFLSGLKMAGISYLILYLYWRHRNRKDKFDELMDKYGYPVGKIGLMVFILLFFLVMQYFDLLKIDYGVADSYSNHFFNFISQCETVTAGRIGYAYKITNTLIHETKYKTHWITGLLPNLYFKNGGNFNFQRFITGISELLLRQLGLGNN